jgi:hypothetical protein
MAGAADGQKEPTGYAEVESRSWRHTDSEGTDEVFAGRTPLPKLDRLPALVLDGQSYAPGTHDETLSAPVLPGDQRWELRALPQPPIFCSWQQW